MIDIEKARALVDVFRDQSQRIICQGTSPFALKVADLIDALMAERDALAREVDACAAALPGPYYMDPPDGGDVPISEQVKRMARDAARYRHLRVQRWFHDEVISASDKGPRDPDNVDTEIDRDMQFEAMKGASDE